MTQRFRAVTWCALAIGGATTVPAFAQQRVEIGPLVGYYRPMRHYQYDNVYDVALPNTPQDLSAIGFGASAHFWYGHRIALDVQASIAQSRGQFVTLPNGFSGRTPFHEVVNLSAQALFDVLPGRTERDGVWVAVGPGIVRHQGDAYRHYGAQNDVAGVAGVEISRGIGSRLRITAGENVMVYNFNIPYAPDERLNPGNSAQYGRQCDALFQIGLVWTARH